MLPSYGRCGALVRQQQDRSKDLLAFKGDVFNQRCAPFLALLRESPHVFVVLQDQYPSPPVRQFASGVEPYTSPITPSSITSADLANVLDDEESPVKKKWGSPLAHKMLKASAVPTHIPETEAALNEELKSIRLGLIFGTVYEKPVMKARKQVLEYMLLEARSEGGLICIEGGRIKVTQGAHLRGLGGVSRAIEEKK